LENADRANRRGIEIAMNQTAIATAIAHHQAGRLHEAEAGYRQILGQQPEQPDALHLLGVLASQVGQHQAALELIARAISLNPRAAEYHGNLGVALGELGRTGEAIAAYQRAIALQPNAAQYHNNLGSALRKEGRLDEAVTSYHQALYLRPDYADPHYNLANIYKDVGKFDEAAARYRHALALRPDWLVAYNNLGNALCAAGRFDEATTVSRQALAKLPQSPLAHWNFGLMLLRHGDLENGLPEYEWRWQARELRLKTRNFVQPRWDGSDLAGRRILLHAEQGFGDTIQFIRYVPMVRARGGKIIVAAQPELTPLLQCVEGVEQWIPTANGFGDFDVHCPLASLPGVMKTTAATIPAMPGYLQVNEELRLAWQEQVAAEPGLKVGIAWAGGPSHPHDRERSMRLAQLRPLAEVPGVTVISLQKGAASKQSVEGIKVIDWTEEIEDFADTAALIANLDLVISVDTAVAHLAGAMGKPVWVLLAMVPDWRWMLDRQDSPWYPTMRLWRQKRWNDWQAPVAAAAEALAKFPRA
jgi:Flp pilus assembly protein TadD